MLSVKDKLISRIRAKEADIGIIGMGYVGLPLALHFLEAGFSVTGFDIDSEKVKRLNKGESYIRHIPSSRIRWTHLSRQFLEIFKLHFGV